MFDASAVINGKEVFGSSRGTVSNPAASDEIVGTFPMLGGDEVFAAVSAAAGAGPAWAARSATERADLLRSAADAVAAADLPTLLVREQGKVLWEAHAEADFYPMCIDAYGALTSSLDDPEVLASDDNGVARLYREPLGVVAAVTAWNWPVSLAVGKLVPALIAGNTVVVKPSPVDPLAVCRLVAILNEFLPAGVLNVVTGEDLIVGSALFEHAGVNMTSFTGGVGGGRAAALAGAHDFRRLVLELGGNDAALVLDDAEIDGRLCAELATAAFVTSGQVCIDIKRIYAPRSKVQQLAEGMAAFLDTYVVGDGLNPASTIGPVTTAAQHARITSLAEAAREAGGAVRPCGRIDGDEEKGRFLRPAIVTGLNEDHPLVAQEQFGPILPIQGYDEVDEAVAYVNGTDFGLTASVWSPDVDRAVGVARRLRAGGSFVNVHGLFCVNPMLPFGGVKSSGMGREYGLLGLQSYTEPHVVSTWHAPVPA